MGHRGLVSFLSLHPGGDGPRGNFCALVHDCAKAESPPLWTQPGSQEQETKKGLSSEGEEQEGLKPGIVQLGAGPSPREVPVARPLGETAPLQGRGPGPLGLVWISWVSTGRGNMGSVERAQGEVKPKGHFNHCCQRAGPPSPQVTWRGPEVL